ncbi:hypothetical protein MSG28_011928 [Choristoneura fumiferana]|uniref:Uncharacterized protein n=1 Tax=Choristoneura fumiferana TaxID=7141 RepID=A0ACC0KN34_CHOFU|nr:hypothetical protein MSG28_011928 [Choristoneura fumiferana]
MFHRSDLMIGKKLAKCISGHGQTHKEIDTAILVSQYYCHRLRSCKSPANGPVCGYSDVNHYLADFPDECAMFKTNCDGKGRVVFYLIEKEICDMKKKYDEEHKNEIFEWERISRVTFFPSATPSSPITQLPPEWKFSQRMKLAM